MVNCNLLIVFTRLKSFGKDKHRPESNLGSDSGSHNFNQQLTINN